jgi:hypothetical protein
MGGVAAPELPVPGGIIRCPGHVGVCERTSCPSSCLSACMRGYPVSRVPIMASGPILGEAANLQVGLF